jgi:hypothetical protein
MPLIGLLIQILAWAAFVLAGVGLFFWAVRWFPRQRWLPPSLALLFVLLAFLARFTKWAIPLMVLLLLGASGFIPRRR